MEEMYTQQEAAKLLKFSTKTIGRMIKKGTLEATRIGKTWRITGESLKKIMTPQEQPTETIQN